MKRLAPLLLVFVLVIAACERQQDLCFTHDEHDRELVTMLFDWSLHPEASPATMSVYLFPDDGSESLRYEFTGCEGGAVRVPDGRYTAIAINSDMESMKVRNAHSLAEFDVSLRDAYEMQGLSVRSADVPRAPGAEQERMTMAAEHLYRARVDDVVVALSRHSRSTLVLQPVDVAEHYSISISEVDNLEGVNVISASLSGMAGAMLMNEAAPAGERVTISFELTATGERCVEGELLALGHCGGSRSEADDNDVRHHITVYAVLNDGSQWYHSFDVTDQIHRAGGGECAISLRGLTLPASGPSGGGFDISVGGWEVVPQILPM